MATGLGTNARRPNLLIRVAAVLGPLGRLPDKL